ncbi:MAG: rod shape-determining protein MreC [Desulfovibrionaceae bacterium]
MNKRYVVLVIIFFVLFIYLVLYTWNVRSGVIDRIASSTGLEVVSTVLAPGIWIEDVVSSYWKNHIYLVGVNSENILLQEKIALLQEEVYKGREAIEENRRLRAFFQLSDSKVIPRVLAQVIAIRFGPQATVNTLVVNKGYAQGVHLSAPVLISEGLVGRIIRDSRSAALVQPITSPNSRISVIAQDSRVSGVLVGSGDRNELDMLYVPRSESVSVGEILVTSGVDGIFPKGLPVATISYVGEEELFYVVKATPLVRKFALEEVFILQMDPKILQLSTGENQNLDEAVPDFESLQKENTF